MDIKEAARHKRFTRSTLPFWLAFKPGKYDRDKLYLSIEDPNYITGIHLTYEDIIAEDYIVNDD